MPYAWLVFSSLLLTKTLYVADTRMILLFGDCDSSDATCSLHWRWSWAKPACRCQCYTLRRGRTISTITYGIVRFYINDTWSSLILSTKTKYVMGGDMNGCGTFQNEAQLIQTWNRPICQIGTAHQSCSQPSSIPSLNHKFLLFV